MFLIAFRMLVVLALAYLFGLLVAWLASLFSDGGGGGDYGGDEPVPPIPPLPGKSKHKSDLKRLVEVDESYYLEEFDLSKKP